VRRRSSRAALALAGAVALLAAALLAAAAPAARAQARPPSRPQIDWDDQQAEEGNLWSRVLHPHRERYRQLLEQAAQLRTQGNAGAAIAAFREAVALEPREPLAYWLLGDVLYAQRQWSECGDALATLLRLRPDFAVPGDTQGSRSVEMKLGNCLSLAGRVEEAVPHYQHLLAAGGNIDVATVHWNLGDCYQFLGRLDEAIDQYNLGIAARTPPDAMIHLALGVAYDRDEQVSRSREAIGMALRLDGQLSRMTDREVFYLPPEDIFYYYGLAHEVASEADPPRRAAAIAYFRRYLEKAGASPWAERARAHLRGLGVAAVRESDVVVTPDLPERTAVVKAVAAAGPELQKCLGGADLAVTAMLPLDPNRKLPVVFSVAGPDAMTSDAHACVDERLHALTARLPVTHAGRVRFAFGAPGTR
jgi:tetratricopeptide (TPR) repeat protein